MRFCERVACICYDIYISCCENIAPGAKFNLAKPLRCTAKGPYAHPRARQISGWKVVDVVDPRKRAEGSSLGPPVATFYPFFGEGSPTKTDYRKKGTLILSFLLEDPVLFSDVYSPDFDPLTWRRFPLC